MENYKKEAIFKDNLDEFDDSKQIVESLIEEYKAAEKPDYIDWGFEDSKLDENFA